MYWILYGPTFCRRYAKGTSGGLFSELLRFDEYLVIPFGLTNAPGQFQGHINECFSDMLDRFLQTYIDDFLIHSKRCDHDEHVKAVLERIIEKKLSVKLAKCKFDVTRSRISRLRYYT